MELTHRHRPRLRAGRAQQQRLDWHAGGTIPIDSLFSPVKKVNFTVTNARVGQQTDYDKSDDRVWTNGAVTPDDAIAYAAKILKEQLNIFINFEETAEPVDEPRGR